MMKIAITEDGDGVHVWAMLDDDSFNPKPHERGESFIIGTKGTAPASIAEARRTLDLALEQLAILERAIAKCPLCAGEILCASPADASLADREKRPCPECLAVARARRG